MFQPLTQKSSKYNLKLLFYLLTFISIPSSTTQSPLNGSYQQIQTKQLGTGPYSLQFIEQTDDGPPEQHLHFLFGDSNLVNKFYIQDSDGAVSPIQVSYDTMTHQSSDFQVNVKKTHCSNQPNGIQCGILLDNGFLLELDPELTLKSSQKIDLSIIGFPDSEAIDFKIHSLSQKTIVLFKNSGNNDCALVIYDFQDSPNLTGEINNPISHTDLKDMTGIAINQEKPLFDSLGILLYKESRLFYLDLQDNYLGIQSVNEVDLGQQVVNAIYQHPSNAFAVLIYDGGSNYKIYFFDTSTIPSGLGDSILEIDVGNNDSVIFESNYLIHKQRVPNEVTLIKVKGVVSPPIIYSFNPTVSNIGDVLVTNDAKFLLTISDNFVYVHKNKCHISCLECSGVMEDECGNCKNNLSIDGGVCKCLHPTMEISQAGTECDCLDQSKMDFDVSGLECVCRDPSTMQSSGNTCLCKSGLVPTPSGCGPVAEAVNLYQLEWEASQNKSDRIKGFNSSILPLVVGEYSFYVDLVEIVTPENLQAMQANNFNNTIQVELKGGDGSSLKVKKLKNEGVYFEVTVDTSKLDYFEVNHKIQISFLPILIVGGPPTVDVILKQKKISLNVGQEYLIIPVKDKKVEVGGGLGAVVGSISFFSLLVFVLSSMFICSNFSQRVIKLFQIIEFFSIFYYLPVKYGSTLNSYFAWLIQLGDLVEMPQNLILRSRNTGVMKSYNKLTKDDIPKELLSSFTLLPVIITGITSVYLALYILKLLVVKKIFFLETIRKIEYTLIDFSVIELSFYTSYSLLSSNRSLLSYSPGEIASKLCSIIISIRIIYIYSDIMTTLSSPPSKTNQPGFYYTQFKDSSTKTSFESSRLIRVIEPLFVLRLVFSSIVVVTTQYLPLPSILIILIIHISYLTIFVVNCFRFKIYSGIFNLLNKISIEISLSLLFTLILVSNFSGIRNKYLLTFMEYLTIIFSLICILSELLMVVIELLISIKNTIIFFSKKKGKEGIKKSGKGLEKVEPWSKPEEQPMASKKDDQKVGSFDEELPKKKEETSPKTDLESQENGTLTPMSIRTKRKNHFTYVMGKKINQSKFSSNKIIFSNVRLKFRHSPFLTFRINNPRFGRLVGGFLLIRKFWMVAISRKIVVILVKKKNNLDWVLLRQI